MATKTKPAPKRAAKKKAIKKSSAPDKMGTATSIRFSPSEEKELERRRQNKKLRSFAAVIRQALGFKQVKIGRPRKG